MPTKATMTSLLVALLCLLLLTTPTFAIPQCKSANGGGSADDVDCRKLHIVTLALNRALFNKKTRHDAGMKIYNHIVSTALTASDIATACPGVEHSFQHWDAMNNQIQAAFWYNDSTGADTFAVCGAKLVAERSAMQTKINQDAGVIKHGLEVNAITLAQDQKPLTCFNGVKDQGEVDVDCGNAACGLSCASGEHCLYNEDCIENCFAEKCMIINAATTTTTTSPLTLLTLVLVVSVLMSVVLA